MTDTLPFIRTFLESTKLDFEIMDCDPDLADTNIFCKKYGISFKDAANTIVMKSKTGELKYAACVLLATTKLDTNKTIAIWHNKLRKRMLKGLKDESYYLLIAYHGFWFLPKFVLDFLYKRFKRNSKWELYVFSYLLEKVLVVRSYTITQYLLITIIRLKQRGFVFVIKKILSKIK